MVNLNNIKATEIKLKGLCTKKEAIEMMKKEQVRGNNFETKEQLFNWLQVRNEKKISNIRRKRLEGKI